MQLPMQLELAQIQALPQSLFLPLVWARLRMMSRSPGIEYPGSSCTPPLSAFTSAGGPFARYATYLQVNFLSAFDFYCQWRPAPRFRTRLDQLLPTPSATPSYRCIMDGTLGVLELEIRLGFNFSRGLSRAKGVRDHPVLSRLLSGLDTINSRFVSYSTKRIRTSEGIKREAQALFQQLGPSLWPGPSEPCPYWLFDSPDNEHETATHRLYPRNLHYSNSDDRDL